MPQSARRVTIADVAAAAGVSLSTVSRSLNGNPTVDPALAERVRAAAASLNYSASPVARSLVLGRTQTVAVLVPDLGNPTFQGILRGISRAASAAGYQIVVADSAESVAEERTLAVQTRRRADGIILCAPRLPQDELEQLVSEIGPTVLVNRETTNAPSVRVDYGAALGDQLEHLYALGHRDLVYLAGIERSVANATRLRAIDAYLHEHADVTITRMTGGVDFEAGERAASAVLATGATAVLAFNDLVATGLLTGVRADGHAVPGDLSVVGFDDIPFARHVTPPLTTATVPASDVGSAAWHMMSRLLHDEAVAGIEWFRPELIVRASTAPPSGRAR